MEKIKIAKRKLLVKNLVILDGISRAGKFFLGRIMDGFNKVEHFQAVDLIEIIPYLYKFGSIREDAAIALLQILVDQSVHDMRIGRNLNFRPSDASSLSKCFDKERYLKRMSIAEGPGIIRDVKRDGRYSVFITHEVLSNVGIFFKAFPNFKMISISRHPVDLIHSWYVRGFGERETKDPLSLSPFIKIESNLVPWFAYRWSKEYSKLCRIDRVIKIIDSVIKMSKETYNSLSDSQKKDILFINYEGLIEDSWFVIKKIGSFLKITPSKHIPMILTREKCLRKIPYQEREKKIENIRKIASPEFFRLMMKLSLEYKKNKL